MAKITVGPVIGKVTDTTARILIEVDDDVQVTCIATDTNKNVVTQANNSTKNRPFIFKLHGLMPETEYEITFKGVASTDLKGRVRTFATNLNKLNIAAVSCNFFARRDKTDLWANLKDVYLDKREVDLVLHVGDQIYGDSTFARALGIIESNEPKSKKAQDEQILEGYRRLYRVWWNDPSTRYVLANVSNLMIWDDHEIRDDWGSREADYDPKSSEYRIGTLARQVYREYQRQLWDDFDINVKPNTSDEHHFHVWGAIGVLFVDQRSGRSFGRDAARPYLGTRQWDQIEGALKTGDLSKVRALIAVTSVPLVYLGRNVTNLGSSFADDLYDHWSYVIHSKEQIEMLRALREWKQGGNNQKELLVVGGDVHVGGYTDIKHEGKTMFKQLITSPITNTPPKWYEFYGLKILTEVEQSLPGSSYSFEHYGLTNKRNYGIIIVRVPTDGVPKVNGSLAEEL